MITKNGLWEAFKDTMAGALILFGVLVVGGFIAFIWLYAPTMICTVILVVGLSASLGVVIRALIEAESRVP